MVNERDAERAQELIDHAKRSTKATSEPAYRLLQILAKVRGETTQLILLPAASDG